MPNCVLSIFSRDMWPTEEEETDFIHDLNNSSSTKYLQSIRRKQIVIEYGMIACRFDPVHGQYWTCITA